MCTLQASDRYNITKTSVKSLHLLMFIFTEILFQTGLVSSEEFLSVQREDVVGSHIEETAKKIFTIQCVTKQCWLQLWGRDSQTG